jgi:hypothetical protein
LPPKLKKAHPTLSSLESIPKKPKKMANLLLSSEVLASGRELGRELRKKKGSGDKG